MDIQTQLDQVSNNVTQLLHKLNELTSSNTISREIETAFRERLQISLLVSSNAVTGSASTQNITITATPQTITVPAQPSGTIAVTINGVTYNLLYK